MITYSTGKNASSAGLNILNNNVVLRYQSGPKGDKGDKGDPGDTPYINPTNNHWYIGDYDTGVDASGVASRTAVTISRYEGLLAFPLIGQDNVLYITEDGSQYIWDSTATGYKQLVPDLTNAVIECGNSVS